MHNNTRNKKERNRSRRENGKMTRRHVRLPNLPHSTIHTRDVDSAKEALKRVSALKLPGVTAGNHFEKSKGYILIIEIKKTLSDENEVKLKDALGMVWARFQRG